MLYYIFKFICDLVRIHARGVFCLILGAKDLKPLCTRQKTTAEKLVVHQTGLRHTSSPNSRGFSIDSYNVQYQLRIVTWCSSALSNRSKNLPGFLNSMYPSTPRWAMLVSSLPIETTFRLIDCTRNSAFSINTPLSSLNMIRLIAQYYLSHNLENLLKTQNTRSAAENASKDFILLRKWGTGKESARRYLTFPW